MNFNIENAFNRRSSIFVLAQLLAIISGAWIVGAGIFLGYVGAMDSLKQNQIEILINYAVLLFKFGLGSGFLSIFVWLFGSSLKYD